MQRSVEPGEGLVLPQLGEEQSNPKLPGDYKSNSVNGQLASVKNRQQGSLDIDATSSQNDMVDYTVHPLVLGPAYSFEDFSTRSVNLLDSKSSGVTLVGINKGVHFASKLRAAKLLTTFQVRVSSSYYKGNIYSTNQFFKKKLKTG